MHHTYDPYGEEYGDWEDPEVHTDCTGCAVCLPWEGRPYGRIRSDRRALVRRWRIAQGVNLPPEEAAQQDRDYWNNQ
jgi:hypothetical protein